jgi:hypothetical protein
VLASRHATTFSRAQELKDLPLPDGPLPDPANPTVAHAFQRAGDRLRIETRAGNKVLGALVEYAFGSRDHFMSFVGRDDQGRSCMLRISHFDSPKGSGWVLSTGFDPHPAHEDGFLGNTLPDYDGVRRCLSCHTTNFRAAQYQVGPEAADHAIGCEGCHGPGGHHVAAVAADFPDLAIVNPAQAPGNGSNRLCGRCHSQHQNDGILAPQTDPVWIRFQGTTLTWSRCFTESEGAFDCMTCHDPHHDAQTSTAYYEARCLSCHSGPTLAPSSLAARETTAGAGSRPTICPVSPAQGCLPCHMPRFEMGKIHPSYTDHYIRVRPKSVQGG